MEAAKIILRRALLSSARSKGLPFRCPSVAGAIARPDHTQRFGTLPSPEFPVSLKRSLELAEEPRVLKITNRRANLEAKHRELECAKLRKDLEVTDDIVNSETKLHALFLKWLSHFNKPRFVDFDVEDENAFRERFEIFKRNARFINKQNKISGSFHPYGLNQFAVMTRDEYERRSGEVLIKSPIRYC